VPLDAIEELIQKAITLKAENERLENDLLDALDLKEGHGPTALSMLKAENERLKGIADINNVYAYQEEIAGYRKELTTLKAENERLMQSRFADGIEESIIFKELQSLRAKMAKAQRERLVKTPDGEFLDLEYYEEGKDTIVEVLLMEVEVI